MSRIREDHPKLSREALQVIHLLAFNDKVGLPNVVAPYVAEVQRWITQELASLPSPRKNGDAPVATEKVD